MKVPKLKHIAHKIVSSGEVPKCIIACTVVRIQHSPQYNNWKKSASIPLDIYINHRNENFELFSFPEYSEKRKQLEPRTLDPTHILTNLRAQACRKGFDFFDKNSLLHVSEINSKLLPRPMVTEVLDQQNAELAKRLFSKRVQRIMERNRDLEEAKFVQLVRQWYKACDECGLHPNIRVNHWIEMHKFLTTGIHFDDYPMGSTHIKGIPIIMY